MTCVEQLGGGFNRQPLDHGGDLRQQAALSSVVEPRLGRTLGGATGVDRFNRRQRIDQFDQCSVDGVLLGIRERSVRQQFAGTQDCGLRVGFLAGEVGKLHHGPDRIAEVADVSCLLGSSELAVDQLQRGFLDVTNQLLGTLHGGLALGHVLAPLDADRCGQIVERRSALGLHVVPCFGRRKGFNLYRSGSGGGCRHGFWGGRSLLLLGGFLGLAPLQRFGFDRPADDRLAATACLSAACRDLGRGLLPSAPPCSYSFIILRTFCDTTLLELPFLSGTWSLLWNDLDRCDTGLLLEATLGARFDNRRFGRGGCDLGLLTSGLERRQRWLTLLSEQRKLGTALGGGLRNLDRGYG